MGVFFLQLTHIAVKSSYPLVKEIQKIVLKSRKFRVFLFARHRSSDLHAMELGLPS